MAYCDVTTQYAVTWEQDVGEVLTLAPARSVASYAATRCEGPHTVSYMEL